MSLKNVYLFKVVLRDTTTNTEVPVNVFKGLFDEIFARESKNNAIQLTVDYDPEPIMLDILENTDEYLFARLNKKRPNNAMQKRDYTSFETADVLPPDEISSNGVELFTYCILGYSHGILSVVNSKGAPNERALERVFGRYNNRYSLETHSVPNPGGIRELLAGRAPEINRVQIEIAQPDAQIMQEVFGFTEDEVLEAVQSNTSYLSFEIKPVSRGALSNNRSIITQLVNALQQNRARYHSVVLSGKKSTGERQQEYDLYEEYFKYPINITEYRQENGRKVEVEKSIILRDYKGSMMNVYNHYKNTILTMTNR